MSAEQRPSRPQLKHGIDPMESLMDYLGLPRDAKYDFADEALERFMKASEAELAREITRPKFRWDTVQDAIQITFKRGTDYSKRVLLDERRFVDHDREGNLTGVVLRDVSQGIMVEGLPEERRIGKMLRRRDIEVITPERTMQLT